MERRLRPLSTLPPPPRVQSCHLGSEYGNSDASGLQRETPENLEKDEVEEGERTGIENWFHLFQEPCRLFIVNYLFKKINFSYIQNSKLLKISSHDETHSEQKRAAQFVFP